MIRRLSYEISIPILNEEKNLYSNVRKCVEYISRQCDYNSDIRLVIADNGSTDSSPRIAQMLSEEFDMVHYIRVEGRGVGRALKRSWAASTADIVGYMDLDLATDLRHLNEAFGLLQGDADVITGSRLSCGAKVIGRSLKREFTSRVFNKILKLYFRTNFDDGMCGFKFLRRNIVSDLIEMGADSDGWFFATELLVCAESAGLRVVSLPVEWRDSADSKVRIVKLTIEYLRAMRRLKARLGK